MWIVMTRKEEITGEAVVGDEVENKITPVDVSQHICADLQYLELRQWARGYMYGGDEWLREGFTRLGQGAAKPADSEKCTAKPNPEQKKMFPTRLFQRLCGNEEPPNTGLPGSIIFDSLSSQPGGCQWAGLK